MKIIVLIITMISTMFLNMAASDYTYINGSAKPTLGNAMSQVKSYNFDLISNGQPVGDNVPFIDAYIFDQLKKWCAASMPDASFGNDYRYPMSSHLTVIARYSHSTKLSWSGVWQWEVRNFNVAFEFGESGKYVYTFDLPNMKIDGGNFDNSKLYNTLIEKVDGCIYRYNSNMQIKLPKYTTIWNERNLKQYFDNNRSIIEGIYESTNSAKNNSENKYKLAVKRISDGSYILIYLDGANLYDDWTEGEIKCFLSETATPNIFKGKWLMLDKSVNNDCYITFSTNLMQIRLENKLDNYLKLYPTAVSQQTSETNDWSGTGFALKNGYIVTNYHVIEGANSITVQGVKGNFDNSYNVTVVGTDKNNDLALLKISDASFTGFGAIPYSISSTTSEVGEEIFVLGYPLTSTMGDEIKLTTGIISSKTGFHGDVSLYQISAPIQPGNSGGPLFDKKGNIIGVVSAKHAGAENVGYAIKSMYLRNLIESSVNSTIIPTSNSVSTLPLTGKVKSEKNFVFYIHCSAASTTNNVSVSSGRWADNNTTSSTRTIVDPSFKSKGDGNLTVNKIILTPTETVLECSSTNPLYSGWMNISRDAYIQVRGISYKLTNAEGIAYSPNYTYFDYPNQTLKFKLYFPHIPADAESLDFIETLNSDWKIYGLSLK